MPDDPVPEEIAKTIQHADGRDVAELLMVLRTNPFHSVSLFQSLAGHRDPIVRAWVPWAIRRTIGIAGIPIIKHLAKDRDSDVRDVAIEELLELDMDAARSLAPMYRRKLRSKELYEPVTAMWALGTIRDRSSADAIREVGQRATNAVQRNTATVVGVLLGDRPEEIVERIRSHDHELMPWLSKAAALLGTTDAMAALEECAESAPDEECRGWCRRDLDSLKEKLRGSV